MNKSIIISESVKAYFSSHASLAAIGRLDACMAENVTHMQPAMEVIFWRHSQSYRHDYQWNWQVLDTEMTGRPCGKKAKFASKGYFAKQRNRRGRQEGYVIATWHEGG
jgi:hypothetical protein